MRANRRRDHDDARRCSPHFNWGPWLSSPPCFISSGSCLDDSNPFQCLAVTQRNGDCDVSEPGAAGRERGGQRGGTVPSCGGSALRAPAARTPARPHSRLRLLSPVPLSGHVDLLVVRSRHLPTTSMRLHDGAVPGATKAP
ncbi:hypothetical protein HPG69_007628 [Diceros bicornis minor]|uniref:Uncharacterized protein n=1 Tax=Diceros bicornis minor TaxID=77932 RepID=A0A7J7E9X6_DICBM|nr:hypothetical protein HPG69_007628 [Diceros bicornis minor]